MPIKKHHSLFSLLALLIALCSSSTNLLAANYTTGADPDTGLRYWEFADEQVLFRLTQRLPDQTRGFFMARGFNTKDANLIATQCFFQTMFKNTATTGSSRITAKLADWNISAEHQQHTQHTQHTQHRQHKLKLREDWKEIWDQSGASNSARIAFDWSLLPSEISYDAGDYNWGMTSYGLIPGSTFNLAISWQQDNKPHTATLAGIVCPDDR